MEEGIYKVARIIRALEISTRLLKYHYLKLDTEERLVPPGKDALMPPHFRAFTTGGITYELKYTRRIADDFPDKAVFVATAEPATQAGKADIVVVKFADSYCKAAYMFLSEISLAPLLRYCEEVESVGMYVVIMDFVRGELLRSAANRRQGLARRGFCPRRHSTAEYLDHGGWRRANHRFRLGGKAGEVRYPWDININMDRAVRWDPDVTRGGLIKKGHNRTMFRRLTGSELEVSDPPNIDS